MYEKILQFIVYRKKKVFERFKDNFEIRDNIRLHLWGPGTHVLNQTSEE